MLEQQQRLLIEIAEFREFSIAYCKQLAVFYLMSVENEIMSKYP